MQEIVFEGANLIGNKEEGRVVEVMAVAVTLQGCRILHRLA
jgi:hypothetical protein